MRCPRCHYALPEPAPGRCPTCGADLPRPQANPFAAPRASGGAAEAVEATDGPSSLPWEEAYSAENLFETMRRVLFETRATFGAAPKARSISPAFLFAFLLSTVCGLLGAVAQALLLPRAAPAADLPPLLQGLLEPGWGSIVQVPISVVFGLFLGTAICHVLLMIVGGANHGFEATFRVVCFTSGALAPLQVIPALGPFVAAIWALVIQILGIMELHETSGGKAAFAVLAPIGLLCLCVVGGAVAVGASMAGSGLLDV